MRSSVELARTRQPLANMAASSLPSSVSLTSLLNSLHSHLQQQTQLLPTLHAQLGLPPTGLADELLALEKELTSCVERQIDLRRSQVDEWIDKCTQVEVDCANYTKALGAHIKVAGTGIAELRKEHVLPRRFEGLSEHQERLRQVGFGHFRSADPTHIHTALSFKTRTTHDPH